MHAATSSVMRYNKGLIFICGVLDKDKGGSVAEHRSREQARERGSVREGLVGADDSQQSEEPGGTHTAYGEAWHRSSQRSGKLDRRW